MIITITGHTNIEKAVGLNLAAEHGSKYNKQAFDIVYNYIFNGISSYCQANFLSFNDLTFISGMARGVDEVFAIMAIRNNLNLILSIPNSIAWHKNRSLSRGIRAQAIYYDKILSYDRLVKIYEISKYYSNETYPFANFARNQNMVDNADIVFAFKAYNSTGTDDCINRSIKKGNFGGNIALVKY